MSASDDPIVRNFNGVPYGYHNPHRGWAETYAQWIRDNVPAHLDALANAGLLSVMVVPAPDARRRGERNEPPQIWYTVVSQPHVHEWKFDPNTSTVMVADLMCNICPERRSVSNRLPIEIPE